MRKLIYQIQQTFRVPSEGTITLNAPFFRGPMQSQGNQGQATGYSAEIGAGVIVTFHVETVGIAPYTGQNDLGNWQAVLYKTRAGKLGDTAVYSQSQDITSLFNTLRGHVQVDSEGANLQECKLELTNWGVDAENVQGAIRIRIEAHAEFTPHRAPSDVQDANGYGVHVTYSNGVAMMNEAGMVPIGLMVKAEDLPNAPSKNAQIDAMNGLL